VGLLSDVLSTVPEGFDTMGRRIETIIAAELPAERRAWLLWREAQWAKAAGEFVYARRAIDAAQPLVPDERPSVLFMIESEGLVGKLWQDSGEPAPAYELISHAMEGWLLVGDALLGDGDEEISPNIGAGVQLMLDVMLPDEYFEYLIKEMAADPPDGAPASRAEIAVGLWVTDRMVVEAREIIARRISLEGDVGSYSDARSAANNALARTRRWSQLPGWDARGFEVGLRLSLSSAASDHTAWTAAVGQADDGLALCTQMPDGDERVRLESELHTNRGRALGGLQRVRDAIGEYDSARVGFESIGEDVSALRVRASAMFGRFVTGELRDVESLRDLVSELESAADLHPRERGMLEQDVEAMRRLWLAMLAGEPQQAFGDIVGLLEVLHGEQSPLSVGTVNDRVADRLRFPFTVSGTRFARLPNTAIIAFEPGVSDDHPPVFFVASTVGDDKIEWQLVSGGGAGEALRELAHRVRTERDRILTGEIVPDSPVSTSVCDAASAAWNAFPAVVRDAIRRADTVLYMPNAVLGLDAIPFELVLTEEGWLGATRVVTRCPSLQFVGNMLAPVRSRPRAVDRAVVAYAVPDEKLGLLQDAMDDVDVGTTAASMLGFDVDCRQLTDKQVAVDAFEQCGLVHYVGHGIANEIGEWLPLAIDNAIRASDLSFTTAAAPFVFFNACLLGRIRYVVGGSGGRQRGFATHLLDMEAPGVIGAIHAVPDAACARIAAAFYGEAADAPIGLALRNARAALDEAGMNPVTWSSYVLHGDPNARIAAHSSGSSAETVRRWPAAATRYLATGAARHRDELFDALSASDAPEVVRKWARGEAVSAADLEAATDNLLDRDAEGAGVCRVLLGIQRLVATPEDADEAQAIHLTAVALDDSYAVLYVVATYFELLARARPDRRSAFIRAAHDLARPFTDEPAFVAPLIARLPPLPMEQEATVSQAS
jgi:hypothetical protein